MKENYQAWHVIVDDFYKQQSEADKLKFLLKFAVLAPSSHNTQPWAFSVSRNSIHVYREINRRLPIADTNDRQLLLSIGCTIENILIAADYYGYDGEVIYKDDKDGGAVKDLIAVINFKNRTGKKETNESRNDDHLIHSIITRRTNRGKYKDDSISQKILQSIESLQTDGLKMTFVHDKEKIFKLGDIAVAASIESMVDDAFRHELSQHLKHNVTKSKIGMPGFTLGIPTPISFLLPSLMRRFNMEKAAQKQNESLFRKYTPYIAVISTKEDEKRQWLEAGRKFQHLSLILTKEGISFSPWGAPIQIGSFYRDIQSVINNDYRPQIFFRVGYAKKPARHSPRLLSHEVIK
jgi:hypothetical protein